MHQKLRELRTNNHYTTQQMATEVGISKAFYCQLENGKRRLSYDNAVKIAAIFNKKPDEIFYESYHK